MDADRFDVLVELWARGSRRGVMRAVAGLALGGALGFVRPPEIDAGDDDCKRVCNDGDMSKAQIKRLIKKAAKRYGQSYDRMLEVAVCESYLRPCYVSDHVAGAYGLFQFKCPTWKSTPYGRRNMYDARLSALATGWMWKQGRQHEWNCYRW